MRYTVNSKSHVDCILWFQYLQPLVSIIKDNIRRDHDRVQQVQEDNSITAVQQLMDNTGNVSKYNDVQEYDAFTSRVPRLIGFVNGKWPCQSKTDQHDDFKYAHGSVCLSPVNKFLGLFPAADALV